MKVTFKKSLTNIKDVEIGSLKKQLQLTLQKRGLPSEVFENKIKFKGVVKKHLHHHSPELTKTFRSGFFSIVKTPDSKIEVLGTLDLKTQMVLSVSIGLMFLIPALFQEKLFSQIIFLALGALTGFIFFRMGATSHKQGLKQIIEESVNAII